MQRHFFRSSWLFIVTASRAHGKQLRMRSRIAFFAAITVGSMLGCSSEPEQPAAAPAAGGQPAAQNAAPAGMQPGGMPGAMPAGGMPAGGMPAGGMPAAGMQSGAMPGGTPMPNSGSAMNPQQMAQMQNPGAGINPMPTNSGAGAGVTPEQMAQMQRAGAGGNPVPTNPGAGAGVTPEQMAQMQRAGAGGNPVPTNPGAGAGVTPEQMAQMQRAGAAAGANPQPGGAAGAGFSGAPGGGGVPQNPTAQAGTPEYSAQKVVLQLLTGDLSGLEEFISPKCKGLLADVRDGKATDQQKDELKKLFAGLQAAGKPRVESGAKVITVRNAEGSMITFKVKKEGESQKVTEMTVKQATIKKR